MEDIRDEWSIDSKLDLTKLDEESLKIPELHSKYFNFYIRYNRMKRKAKVEYQVLLNNKTRWYMGLMDLSEMKEFGWEPYSSPLYEKITKVNIQNFLDRDKDLISLALTLGELDDITEFIKSILDMISKRGFHIKNAVDWTKLKFGG